METKKLQKLQKHLETLTLVITSKNDCNNMELPTNKQDEKRFSINNWRFDCGMPACVAGHAKFLFDWLTPSNWFNEFEKFFDLSYSEADWIVDRDSYKSKNPTPKTAAKHIQDVVNGTFN